MYLHNWVAGGMESTARLGIVLGFVLWLASSAQASDVTKDTVIIVNTRANYSASLVFTASSLDGETSYPQLDVNATVASSAAVTLDLSPTGPKGVPLLWSLSVSIYRPVSANVQGLEFEVFTNPSRLIRVSQPSPNDISLKVTTNETIDLKNSKPDHVVDKATVLAVNDGDNSTDRVMVPLYVNATSDNCYKCRAWALQGDEGELLENDGMYLKVGTNFGTMFDVFKPVGNRSTRAGEVFNDGRFQLTLEEKGEYLLLCHGHETTGDVVDCAMYQTKRGVDTFAPLWHAVLALFLISVVLSTLLFLDRRYQLWLRMQCRTHDRLVNTDLGDTEEFSGSKYTSRVASNDDSEASEAAGALQSRRAQLGNDASTPPRGKRLKKRLRSLDTFRGLSLIIMIFVNYEGGRYWFFNHSRWNGLTVADCVFPWFIWIMGTSMVISFNSLRRKGLSKCSMAMKVIRRAVILFCIGLFLNNGYDLKHWRIPGVLQRFGVSYLVVGLVDIFVPTLRIVSKVSPVYDIVAYLPQWIIMISLVIIHTAITFGMHVPGCPTGYLGPGGIADDNAYPKCTAGAAGYLDKLLFGPDHTYGGPTCLDTYHCEPYDPEGALGSLTSIFLCFLGCQAGRILVVYEQGVPRITRWIVWGCVLGAIGTGLCQASQNTGLIPINKNLWSLSFILVLGAGAFMLLSVCYILVDVLEIWSGAPFYYPGMNSIFVYVGSELLQKFFPFSFQVSSGHSGILASSLVGVSVWLVVAFYLHHIKFFLKI
eukprot:scpid46106/ scgid2492/ Heparan-alpha-glucosaminide N-acetyltransferase; Transmembrane protein 76